VIYSANTEIYNKVFETQYNSLVTFARQDVDNVHNSYLKTLNRINESVFTASTYIQLIDKLKIYCKTVIANSWKTQQKLRKPQVQIGWEAEQVLNVMHDHDQDERQYHEELEYFTIKLFEYLKRNHTQEDQYVFRVYYLYDERNRKITYKQLSAITGYSISKCCQIIQKIKKDVRLNLKDYINGVER